MRMNKRVYGVIGISSKMSNWNADFSGYPKTTSRGDVFGSDKALKFTMKKKWKDEGKNILYIKSYKINENGILQPRSLKERYEQIFEAQLNSEGKEAEKVLANLFKATDVKNFGATFAEANNNISITAAVQIGQGMNKYKDSIAEPQVILSPFRDSKEKDAKNSTLGTKIVSDEAHYFYSFNINPIAYEDYEKLGVTDGYTEEDYKEFKSAALNSATSFSTNSKTGADNEFTMFIETDATTYLPNLAEYIVFEKGEKNKIKFASDGFLEKIEGIKDIEVYYNKNTSIIEGFPENAKVYDILTNKGE